MNEAQYALLGVAIGVVVPAAALVWQTVNAGRRAAEERVAAREERQDGHRLALIASWREGVAAFEPGRSVLFEAANPLTSLAWYLSLRPHLTDRMRKRLEPPPGTVSLAGVLGPLLQFELADEIARIEREWGLA